MKKVEYALLPFILLYTITLASVAFTANIGVNIAQTFNTGAVAYRRVPLRPFFVGETPPDRREVILVVLSGSSEKRRRQMCIRDRVNTTTGDFEE